MLLKLSFVLMLKTFHFLLKHRVLRVELLISPMNLESLLHLFLHIVTVLFEFSDYLLLSVSSFLRCPCLLFEPVLEEFDFCLVALLHFIELAL